jgi:hypothetical protein
MMRYVYRETNRNNCVLFLPLTFIGIKYHVYFNCVFGSLVLGQTHFIGYQNHTLNDIFTWSNYFNILDQNQKENRSTLFRDHTLILTSNA